MNWISPIALELGPIKIYWYGIMYLLSFIFAYLILFHSTIGKKFSTSKQDKENLLFYSILSILIGGRLGYILLYNFQFYLNNPVKIFTVWDGGMSFHGGLIAIIFTTIIFSNKNKIPFFKITDLIAFIAPIGIFLGRIGNFINAELYGKIDQTNTFCLNFPTDPNNCRYPSQLFQSFSEGLLLFIIIAILQKHQPKTGIISSAFLIFYSIFRFINEIFREPDPQLGLIFLNLSMGQILSILMLFIGLITLYLIQKQK